jgi:hypothetical protein
MKTKIHRLTRVAMGVALATASLSALSTPPPHPAVPGAESIVNSEKSLLRPTFNRAEQAGLCLVDSAVSLIASTTNDFGCGEKTYTLSVVTSDVDTGAGTATIDGGVGVGGTTLTSSLGPTKDIGTACLVRDVSGVNLLSTVYVPKAV